MEKIDNKQIFILKKNLLNNFKIIREKSGNSKIMSVIKGDAYGHGIQECMEILKKLQRHLTRYKNQVYH